MAKKGISESGSIDGRAAAVFMAAAGIFAMWYNSKAGSSGPSLLFSNPMNANVDHTGAAMAFFDKNQPDNALRSFELAATNGGGAEEYHNLGAMLYRQRLWTRALSAYKESLRLNPDNKPAKETYQEIKSFLANGGSNRQPIGVKSFNKRQLAKYNPEGGKNENHLGAALYFLEKEDLEQAAKAFQRNLSRNPKDGRAYNELATLLTNNANVQKAKGAPKSDYDFAYEKALSIYKRANELSPEDVIISDNLHKLQDILKAI
jgi:tetratricopeptide (TPR) repeat protein